MIVWGLGSRNWAIRLILRFSPPGDFHHRILFNGGTSLAYCMLFGRTIEAGLSLPDCTPVIWPRLGEEPTSGPLTGPLCWGGKIPAA